MGFPNPIVLKLCSFILFYFILLEHLGKFRGKRLRINNDHPTEQSLLESEVV